MLSFFRPKLPIDADELEWQLATFKWLQAEFGPVAKALVLPTPHWFPPSQRQGHARMEDLFAAVRKAAGMADWPCELRPGRSERPVQVGFALLLKHHGAAAPCGTFQVEEADGTRRAVITYNPSLAADTGGMIATLAHELGHYLMSTAKSAPPGGWALHELHTDLAAVYLGFGIFLANSARNFAQFQSGGEMGWSSRRQGYLSEGALVTGLALAERLAGRDPAAAEPYLKPYLVTDLRKAMRALARLHPDVAAGVEAVDLGDFAA
ncbi:MAG TPA: hypothetical protein VGC56_13050 [Allosphingosinicella sp.]|jgi:hypothetical protein